MANNTIVMIVVFMLLVNLASAVTMSVVRNEDGKKVFNATSEGGYIYTGEKYAEFFKNQSEKSIQPAGSLEDKGDQVYRVLDLMSFGFINSFFATLNEYLYGFVTMIDNMFGRYMDDETRTILFGDDNPDNLIPNKFGALKMILLISYTLVGISLFTGKNVVES